MLYGLYLSAAGVMTNAYRQDVIANNLANAETTGFKKDLATFRERLTGSQEMPGMAGYSNPLLDKIGGGILVEPTMIETSMGATEQTGRPLDAAIQGSGYFTVTDHGQARLTRNGSFMVANDGTLIMSGGGNQPVLDNAGKPIHLDPSQIDATAITRDGQISQNRVPVAQLGVVDVADPAALRHEGGNVFSYADPNGLSASTSQIEGGYLEGSNVDPAAEMAALMDTQRQLEANANMIHTQDETLDKLVNSVGKIG